MRLTTATTTVRVSPRPVPTDASSGVCAIGAKGLRRRASMAREKERGGTRAREWEWERGRAEGGSSRSSGRSGDVSAAAAGEGR